MFNCNSFLIFKRCESCCRDDPAYCVGTPTVASGWQDGFQRDAVVTVVTVALVCPCDLLHLEHTHRHLA